MNQARSGLVNTFRKVVSSSLQHSELQRFGQVIGADSIFAGKVGDRTGNSSHAIITACTEYHARDRDFE